jgi:alpha-N-arabinofuranosidase
LFDNNLASYETCMAYTLTIEEPIKKTKGILAAMGYLGSIRIAFDEWNLRGWYHPHVHQYANVPADECKKLRELNEVNASYTMADAVFTACFLNVCLKNCDVVGMTNFAPMVNTRGPIQTHREGVVLRPTYFVFKLFTHYLGNLIVDSWLPDDTTFDVGIGGQVRRVPALDIVATKGDGLNDLRVSIVNRHPEQLMTLDLKINGLGEYRIGKMYGISGESKDTFNDIALTKVRIEETAIDVNDDGGLVVEVPPHSVNVLVLSGR